MIQSINKPIFYTFLRSLTHVLTEHRSSSALRNDTTATNSERRLTSLAHSAFSLQISFFLYSSLQCHKCHMEIVNCSNVLVVATTQMDQSPII